VSAATRKDYRLYPFVDIKTRKEWWLLQRRTSPRKWVCCCEGSKPLLYDNRQEGLAKIRALVKKGDTPCS